MPAIAPASAIVPAAAGAIPAAPTPTRGAAPGAPATPPAPATGTTARPQARDARQLQHQFDELLATTSTRLHFRVIEDLGTVAISIIDERTGEVLRQVPSETALRIARRLRAGGGLLDERA
ncbi:flagellar protein FlaG [Cognatiluteimonas weifangensis]|uniref:Flagellar protein FlaG n=1 Tax=Cognatiluteimonas weifangensis TaxID=2303539 RepID=A0A372DR77_9GAMM|nr:flagellar protein FlaG [Luteimonas weifangensis]RFP62059.1 hypothetical protein D0Y53_03130 [Luteimonas weifangensis]